MTLVKTWVFITIVAILLVSAITLIERGLNEPDRVQERVLEQLRSQ